MNSIQRTRMAVTMTITGILLSCSGNVSRGATAICEPIKLKPLPCLCGSVIDPLGAPGEQVKLTVLDNDDVEKAAITTGENGKFSFDGLKPGDYILRVELKGFAVDKFPVKITSGKKCHRGLLIELRLTYPDSCPSARIVKR